MPGTGGDSEAGGCLHDQRRLGGPNFLNRAQWSIPNTSSFELKVLGVYLLAKSVQTRLVAVLILYKKQKKRIFPSRLKSKEFFSAISAGKKKKSSSFDDPCRSFKKRSSTAVLVTSPQMVHR